MNAVVRPPARLRGQLRAPGDRSITVRAVLLGAVASGHSMVRDYLVSEDTSAAIACVSALGVRVGIDEAARTLEIEGAGLHGLRPAQAALDCGSSGATMRLMAGLMAGQDFDSTLDGSPQLRRRPMRRVTEPLREMGAAITDRDGCAPVRINAARLRAIDYDMPVASAQVKSSILLAGLYAHGTTTIREHATTRDHTERMLAACGAPINAQGDRTVAISGPRPSLKPVDMRVPADFSSAAFFIAAGVLHPDALLELPDVGANPTRTGLLDALRLMGGVVESRDPRDEGGEPTLTLAPRPSELHAVDIGGDLAARMIDEFPVLAVLATQAAGTTIVRDAQELRVKESNRIDGLVAELRKLGARIEGTSDGFVVEGPTRLVGAVVDGLGDHRVAMALAVAALIATGETTIVGSECVAKTYPRFFDDLAGVCAA